jgi:hypothetical protein
MECVDSFIRFAITIPVLSVVSGAVMVVSLNLPDPALLTRSPFLQIALFLGFLASAGIANLIAPRMRIRNWGREKWKKGDTLSG